MCCLHRILMLFDTYSQKVILIFIPSVNSYSDWTKSVLVVMVNFEFMISSLDVSIGLKVGHLLILTMESLYIHLKLIL